MFAFRAADEHERRDGPHVVALADSMRDIDLGQAVRLLIALSWLAWSMLWWGASGQTTLAVPMSTFALLGGLAIAACAVVRFSPRRDREVDLMILVGTLLVVGSWLLMRTPLHGYGTDEITTGQASASVLLSGHNPYATDLTSTLQSYRLPANVSTPVFGGGLVHTTSYPALSFLFYVPFGAVLGTTSRYAQVVDIIGWLGLAVLLWKLVDARLRPVVPLIASAFFYVGFVDGGVTDSLFLPFICLAVHRWDRFLDEGQGLRRWIGPLCLGVACATKPLPWLMAPFLVAAIALEASARGRSPWRSAAAYAGAVVAVFAVANLPFIVLDPSAWTRGALLPITQPLVPFGEGLVQLPLYTHIGGGRVGYLGPAALGAVLASLGGFVGWYPRTRRLLPLFAAVPLLLSDRSLITYFACAIPILLVGAVGPLDRRVQPARALRLAGRCALGAGAVVAVAAAVAFVASPAPLRLTVAGEHHATTASGAPAVELTVVATNLTGHAVRPAFAITSGGFLDGSWQVRSGPAEVAPGSHATYLLASADARTALDTGSVFLVDALGTNPDSVSTSDWTVVR